MALTSYPFTALTNSGVGNAKGTYTQIVASTPYDSSRLYVQARSDSTANIFALIDMATGAPGSETVVIANFAVNYDADFIASAFAQFDVDIPAGTRLSARQQTITTGTPSPSIACLLESRAISGLATPVTYGSNTSFSRGTQLDPGATANTKGAYVELTPSTTARIDTALLCITGGVSGTSLLTSFTSWLVDLATGASGSEVVVIPDLVVQGNSVAKTPRPTVQRVAVSIPAGTRLAARCQCDRTTAGERLLCVTLIGMQDPGGGGGGGGGILVHPGMAGRMVA